MHSEEEYYHKADNLMRISCQALQGVFRDTWKRCTGSEWTEASASDFIRGDGKAFYSKCESFRQKRLLEEGKVEEWDLTLLFGLFKCFAGQGHHDENWRIRNAALQTLCKERNRLAHNAQKKISAAAYQQVEATVRASLSKLGVHKEKVDKWISDAELASSMRDLEEVRKIEELGDTEYSKRNYQGARVRYDEALLVPTLPAVKLSTFYEKRATCYLELGMREKNQMKQTGFYDQAMKDIGEALSHSPESSWKAHSIQAHIHQARNELKKAIEHYETALAICPRQTSLKAELDDWKWMQGNMANHAHLNPALQPKTLKETHEKFSKSLGVNMKNTHEEFLRSQKEEFETSVPGFGDVYAGDACAFGWKVAEKSYKEAARHYEKAMAKENALGIFRLVYLYMEGKGVPKNIPYAIDLLKKAANMPEKMLSKGAIKQWEMDLAVRASRHALGMKYLEGVGVGQDYKKAMEWFTKAAQSGCGRSAASLAHMYITGKGVQQEDWKMAEMYLKQAVQHGTTSSVAETLCVVYFELGEPDLAKFWMEKATQFGHSLIYFHMDEMRENMTEVVDRRKELENLVKEFEKKHGLSAHGLTFMERDKRRWVTKIYQMAKEAAKAKGSEAAIKEAEETAKSYAKYLNPVFLRINPEKCSEFQHTGKFSLGADILDVISKRAGEGSVIAQRVMAVSGYIDQFYQLWNEGGPEVNAKALIDLVYQITCLEPHLFDFTSEEMEDEFKCLIRSQFEAHGSDKGDFDMKLRICYAMYANDMGKNFGIQVLKEGMRRYPNEIVYCHQLSFLYGRICAYIEDYQAGLDIVNQGLDRFPDDVGLLYYKAVYTHQVVVRQEGEKRYQKILEKMGSLRRAFKDFIKLAPEDHRKVPEAYYFVSQSYVEEMEVWKKIAKSEVMDDNDKQRTLQDKHRASAEAKVLKFYEMGKRAEEKQLPCYLPYESRKKSLLPQWVLEIRLNLSEEDCSNIAGEKSWTWDGTLPQFITNNKDYMKDPTRILLVKQHRSTFRDIQETVSSGVRVVIMGENPAFQQKFPKNLAGLQAITLQEIDRSQENIHEGKILNLTLIEEPIVCCATVQTVAMDENRDTIRVAIFNDSFNEEIKGKLRFGCKLSVLNPYMRLCLDEVSEIRVDDPESIIYQDKVENMCRYCGQENAHYSCGKCGWAKYCDRECQVADWKELKHKLICKPNDELVKHIPVVIY